ncbi:hypothetical protein HHJ77_05450 [Mobiluncus mulieris]|uniref:Mrr-like domain-containing protein n=1 Tax=Mobiluncus mulieris TaxID=2052 RepID=A0A7Y0UTD2_9ACTO|nr:hypothetical protein [Mobiluncus mulieris]NMX12013.1 hypothetical protein [Mobiluncus mulieris]
MAVQCKFYQPQTKIQKEHLDSFLSESGKEPFKRRIFVETAGVARSQTVGFNPTGTHHADRRPTRCQPGSCWGTRMLRENRVAAYEVLVECGIPRMFTIGYLDNLLELLGKHLRLCQRR